ncbi:MAG: aminotransferase class V-fold PLP-dependent enzyme [Ruminococcaceae bacterium]|nr:aminotransferase class V-fold PLP-dependent enzyme [Oscillospiraceae bacterium]
MLYFDNAATSYPKPAEVSNAIYSCITKFGGNPGRSGHKMSINAAKIVYNMRENVASFFGIDDCEQVILTKNCTESLNIAIFSVMKHGGNAIISNFEHNSVIRPLEYLKKSGICDYKIANVSFENPEITAYEFKKLIDLNTKMIICTHASNVTGKIAPIKEISEICRQKNIIFCLDASQTAGIIPINMQSDNIDVLCCPGHKALFGPTGTGLLIANKKIKLSPIIFGGTGSLSTSYEQPDFLPDLLESGTVNVPGAAGISAGISFINRVGIQNIYSHELKLLKRFYGKAIKKPKIIVYSGVPEENKNVATISFGVKGKTSTEISQYLDRKNIAVRGGLHCSPLAHKFLDTTNTGTVRASFSIFNTEKEIDYLCNVLDSI